MSVKNTPKRPLAIVCSDPEFRSRAEAMAEALDLSVTGNSETADLPPGSWLLKVDEGGLAMQQTGRRAPGPVRVDFVGGRMGFRRQRQEATPDLVKAIGARSGVHPRVWDLTAGMGQDAFILARHGCPVMLFERNPVVYQLLADGLERAWRYAEERDVPLRTILERLTLVRADSIQVLSQPDSCVGENGAPEVIYIDTMFPERGKSARVKKGMQLFQDIVGEDADAEQLLPLALQRAHNRVVVKRPRQAPALAGSKPALSFSGKSIRFDVYPLRKLERK